MPEDNKYFSPLSLTEEELRRRCEEKDPRTDFSYNDFYTEMQRKTQDRQAKAIERLTKIGTYLAIVTTILAVITTITGVVEVMHSVQETTQNHEARLESARGIEAC